MGGSRRGRILVITSNFPRWEGDTTTPFVLHLAQDLQALGWEIQVLAPHAEGTASRETLEGVAVERFRYLWPASMETVCYQGGALVNLRERRSNAVKVPALVGAELLATMRRLRGGRFDLLHSHWILPQGFVGAVAARAFRLPHVVTVHGGDIFALRGRVMGAFKRFALHHADAVTANSSATEEAVLRVGPRVREIQRIPMGVAAPTPEPASVAQIRSRYRRGNGPLLVFLGRIVDEKGVEDLIRAVPLLASTLPDVTALMVGEGQHRRSLERLAEELGLTDRIRFAGWVAPKEVPSYLAAADVCVAPSRQASDGWIEAQGLTVLEAMAAGTPVVATRMGGIPDAVRDGETGLLVPERSPTDIAKAVERLAERSDLATRLSTAGKQLVDTRFSREEAAESFSRLFERLRRGRPERSASPPAS